MNTCSTFIFGVLVASMVALGGCAGLVEDPDGEAGVSTDEILTENALTENALTTNALTTNALTTNALTTNALTTNALTTNALVRDALRDPLARQFFSYVVRCALPEGAHVETMVDGVTYGFDGELGLQEQWGDPCGKCDASCQGWISGCVIARVNYLGEQVPISIRGNKSELTSNASERTAYSVREATYYGNVFTSPQRLYGCISPGQTSIPRVCGSSLESCAVTIVGPCDTTCDKPDSSGAFQKCRDHQRIPNTCKFPAGTTEYDGPVTVFLRP
jgi:hypothetical protein